MWKIGIDIGGTFTDFAYLNEETGDLAIGKTLTTAHDPSEGVIEGLRQQLPELSIAAAEISNVIHGTTLVANALIERKGAKTGLLTTKGFRHLLVMGREKRFDSYDMMIDMPKPLVELQHTLEVDERLYADGTVRQKLKVGEVRKLVKQLKRQGIEAIAVSLLHSYRNPEHEQRIGAIIEAEPGIAVTLSSNVVAEIREFERTSTTVANAFVQPVTKRYLEKFRTNLDGLGIHRELFMMHSSGGIIPLEVAERFPVRMVESGPAAGAMAAAYFGELLGVENILSFDMGGTTAKTCLIDRSSPMVTTEGEVARTYRFKQGSGLPIKLPMVDLIEIGAGGGSIARVDDLGLLKVGPDSSSSDPGPVCYGLGGTEPTVTDSDLVLGYLDPAYFLGGKMKLDAQGATQTLDEKIARPLNMPIARAAWGIHEVVNENMANSARVHCIERGQNPSDYAMVAFGGAGPVHAYRVAEKLKIDRLIIPASAGVASAFGLLVVPFTFDLVRTYVDVLPTMDWAEVNRLLTEMETEGRDLLQRAGVPEAAIEMVRSCDIRYAGQGWEIKVSVPGGQLGEHAIEQLRKNFDAKYLRVFHRVNEHRELECLSWRVVARGPRPRARIQAPAGGQMAAESAPKGSRQAYFPEADDYLACPVYDRYKLQAGMEIAGPAIIEETESTTIIGPKGMGKVDRIGSIDIRITR